MTILPARGCTTGLPGLVVVAALSGLCLSAEHPGPKAETDRHAARPDVPAATPPERLRADGIENLYRLGPGLLSGGQPEGEAAFKALKGLGVKTIVSVDGAAPDLETARRFGIRYVHLPVGYDGIPREQAVRLVKAVKDLPGPAFVHCHHGKHRGPAAAALCGIATAGWSRAQARSWLDRAGTDPEYKGLFADVDRFVPPSADELHRVGPDGLPERAEVPDLVASMVRVDAHWDGLKAVQKAGHRTPPGRPDLDPPHEALILAEQFREAARRPDVAAKGGEFTRLLNDAGRDADDLSAALRTVRTADSPAARRRADDAFARVGRSCTSCHARFRDAPGRR